MRQPCVRAIVLNYNGGSLVERTFTALEATDWPRDRLDLVMVDNASTDGSRDAVSERFPGVSIIDSPENAGFPANNLALRSLDDVDYVALINSDAFVDPHWLEPLVESLLDDPRRGAACPRILLASRFVDLTLDTPAMAPVTGDPRALGVRLLSVRVGGREVLAEVSGDALHGIEHDPHGQMFRWSAPSGTMRVPVSDDDDLGPFTTEVEARRYDGAETLVIGSGDHETTVNVGDDSVSVTVEVETAAYSLVNNAGSVVLRDGSGADRGFLQPDGPAFDQPCDLFAWCGAAVLFRPEYLADVGLFDERFFLYYEDTDLSWRGQLRGWSYRYVPESTVRHVHAATSVEGSPVFRHYTERNRLAMLTKNAPRDLALRAPLRFLWSTGAYARRDIVAPITRGRRPQLTTVASRLRSFIGWLRLLPHLAAQRRRIRGDSIRRDDEIDELLVDTAEVTAR